jgi:hypothetical protein
LRADGAPRLGHPPDVTLKLGKKITLTPKSVVDRELALALAPLPAEGVAAATAATYVPNCGLPRPGADSPSGGPAWAASPCRKKPSGFFWV